MRLYGTVTHETGSWVIRTEPHVAIRLKRVFAKVNQKSLDELRLSDTPENSRDLEWFLDRYPMKVEKPELLTKYADAYREQKTLLEGFLDGSRAPQAFEMKLPPREYQALAASFWLISGGLLLADDVGLGKTAVALAGFVDTRTRPALVVTLTHLPLQWAAEVEKFTGLTTHILRSAAPYDIRSKTLGQLPDIIISNYHKLAGWQETLGRIVRSVVFDECQELRHNESQKYVAAKMLADRVQFRLGLSATPIYNYGGEIFNVLDVLCPGKLGTREEFEREWCTQALNGKQQIGNPKAFGQHARESGLMLRRTRKEVNRELPPVIVVPHEIDADSQQLERCQGNAIELAKTILKQGQDFRGEKMQASAEFDMLVRQATGIAKAPFVAEFVRFLVEDNGEKVVLFGWHRAVYEVWKEKLWRLHPYLYTGTESSTQKEASKRAFVNGDCQVLIVSLRSGAGLDGLQDAAKVCVFGELDWSPGVHEQCIGRLHRDGQDGPVTAYYLLSECGSDPIVSDVLGIKRQQIEGLRDPKQELVAKLQIEKDYIKRLAESFLKGKGVVLSESAPPTRAQAGTPSLFA